MATVAAATETKRPVEIIGYADGIGSTQSNQTLSEMRAQSVFKWYAEKPGVDPNYLKPEGRGESLARDNVEDASQRRVIVVLPK